MLTLAYRDNASSPSAATPIVSDTVFGVSPNSEAETGRPWLAILASRQSGVVDWEKSDWDINDHEDSACIKSR